MRSMVLAGQAILLGSCLTTSAVLKMPCTEHDLTLNCWLQKHSLLVIIVSAGIVEYLLW